MRRPVFHATSKEGWWIWRWASRVMQYRWTIQQLRQSAQIHTFFCSFLPKYHLETSINMSSTSFMLDFTRRSLWIRVLNLSFSFWCVYWFWLTQLRVARLVQCCKSNAFSGKDKAKNLLATGSLLVWITYISCSVVVYMLNILHLPGWW